MSTTKLTGIFVVVVLSLQVLGHQVVGLPVSKKPMATNATNSRNPRLLGKFSFVAGLNLPGHGPPPPASISRNDLLYERVPSQVTFNYPATRWGPYVAAVYEPLPLVSFFHNPLGYLASALNPFNWFSGGSAAPSTTIATTSSIPTKDHEDVVLLIDDSKNEIPNEDRAMDKPVIKITKEPFINNKSPTTTWTTKSIPLRDYVTTIEDNEETITDLVAEETTLNLIERIKNISREVDETRQSGTTRRQTTTRTTTRLPGNMTADLPANMTTGTSENMTISDGIDNANMTTVTPQQNITASPTSQTPDSTHSTYWQGYYYGGNPQNVSHWEFTTAPPAIINPVPQQINWFEHQQRQPQQLPSVDYFGRFDNFLSDVSNNNYFTNDRNDETSDNWYPNGFKPSYQFRF